MGRMVTLPEGGEASSRGRARDWRVRRESRYPSVDRRILRERRSVVHQRKGVMEVGDSQEHYAGTTSSYMGTGTRSGQTWMDLSDDTCAIQQCSSLCVECPEQNSPAICGVLVARDEHRRASWDPAQDGVSEKGKLPCRSGSQSALGIAKNELGGLGGYGKNTWSC